MTASWSDPLRQILINAGLKPKLAGKGSDTGIEKEGWIQITTDKRWVSRLQTEITSRSFHIIKISINNFQIINKSEWIRLE